MTDELTLETFQHLVHLAALELGPEEAAYLHRQLNLQLKSIHELQSIPVDEDVPPARHGVPFLREVSAALRRDEWQPYPDAEEILKQAPQTEERYFVVPEIPHTRLE